MRRSVIGWVVLAVLAIGGAAFAYVFYFAGGSGEPTTDLTTPELTGATTSTTGDDPGSSSTSSSPMPSSMSFEIDPSQSTARFEIDETLRGSPNHVVGTTDQVVGQVEFDPTDLSTVEFSQIIVNARTLTTGTELRDRAIRGPVILDSASDAHELITFDVSSVEGLSGAAEIAKTFDFTVTGDLTVKGITQQVTFDVSVTQVDDSTLEGSATAEVTRDMFEIGIPNVPNVADVTNEVSIHLEFVALAG